MGNRIQHYAGLHMRNIDQIGANFEDKHLTVYKYSYLYNTVPERQQTAENRTPKEPPRSYTREKKQKTEKHQEVPASVQAHSEQRQRKQAKPIQQTLFADVLENERRTAIVFDLQIETMEPGRYCPARKQKILLIHKAEKFDSSGLTKEQNRLYQIGLVNQRLMIYSAWAPAAQNMLKQYVIKRTFGYETAEGKHLVTIRSWK